MPKVYSRGTFSFLLPTLFHRIDHFVAQKTKGGSVIGVTLENPRDENGWASGGIAGYDWTMEVQRAPEKSHPDTPYRWVRVGYAEGNVSQTSPSNREFNVTKSSGYRVRVKFTIWGHGAGPVIRYSNIFTHS